MAIRKMMSEVDKKKFEEEIIKKYKAEHKGEGKRFFSNEFLRKLKVLAPFDIAIGIIASIIFIYLNGIQYFVTLMLYGIIWVTLLTSVISLFIKTK